VIAVGTNGSITPPVESLLKGAQRAEEGGYDSVWWPDHLMGFHPAELWKPEVTPLARAMPNPHIFVDPVAAIAACATATHRVQLGTAVTDVLRRHPAMLAQEFLTLDHFSHGRSILGVGAGEGENTQPYGVAFDRPFSRLAEALEIIRLFWSTTEPVDFDGEFFQLKDAVVGMEPYCHPGEDVGSPPPIWVGAHGPRMLELTGRLADGWLPLYQGGVERWVEGLARIRSSEASSGRAGAVTPALLAHIVVAEDDSQLERLLSSPLIRIWMLTLPSRSFEELGHEHPLGDGAYGLLDYIPTRLDSRQVADIVERVPLEVVERFLVCGTADEISEELMQFAAAGVEHIVLWNLTYLADATLLRSSFAALDQVRRRLQSWTQAGER
jgi:phthiodiolone/phenolphthiodiolone dimycocerosates ketoreductase